MCLREVYLKNISDRGKQKTGGGRVDIKSSCSLINTFYREGLRSESDNAVLIVCWESILKDRLDSYRINKCQWKW